MRVKFAKIVFLGSLFTVLALIFISAPASPAAAAAGELDLAIPGQIQGTGTYFEIIDSQYLNISLTSSAEVKVFLESVPKTISLNIEAAAPEITSTVLALEGLEPNKTYYFYQDSYQNGAVFISDETGAITWEQDLTQPHHLWLQENKGTISLPSGCSSYGIWDEGTKTCTLTQNLTESVEITSDGITLDCASSTITGSGTDYGIYINHRTGITIKNCYIFNFTFGISIQYSSEITIQENNLSSNGYGVQVAGSSNTEIKITENIISGNNETGLSFDNHSVDNSEISRNEVLSNGFVGIHLSGPSNTVHGNNISGNGDIGLRIYDSGNKVIENNITLNGEYGILLEYAWGNTISENNVANNIKYGIRFYCSGQNTAFFNNFINHQQNYNWTTWEGCGTPPPNVLNSPEKLNYTYQNQNFNNYLGNHWSDYLGVDVNSDGVGDIAYAGGLDIYPLVEPIANYTIWQEPPPTGKWSFAVITDLHIGRGYGDYDGATYDDAGDGENYYLTERLKKVVDWVSNNKNNIDCGDTKCPIQFLAVLGDITNTAEKSQFLKAKEILDKLNDPNGDGNTADGIPYVPVFGNHDVWPYTDLGEAASSLGEIYFDDIFWNENATNTQLLIERLNFQRDKVNTRFKNFAFSYKDMNFIGLDFDSRDHIPSPAFETGVYSDAVLGFENEGWLELRLNEFAGKPVIILSHHPLTESGFELRDGELIRISSFDSNEINEIQQIIENKDVIANFAGHIHGFEKFLEIKDYFFNGNWIYPNLVTTSVLTTESLMVGSNVEDPKGIIRIVKVSNENQIDYNNWETTEGTTTEFIGLNPYMTFDYISSSTEPCMVFKGHTYTKKENSLSWEIDGQIMGSGEKADKCFPEAVESPKTYDVKLTAIDNAKPDKKEEITQKIEVKAGIVPRLLKISEEAVGKIELISTSLWEDLTNFGRTVKDNVLAMVKHSPAKPAGLITVHFEQATEDIDLSQMVVDTNSDIKKSILYMPQWPEVIEANKVLFIPK